MLHALQHPSALCPVPVYHGSTRRIAAKAREKALIWRASVSCSCTAVATAATAATAMAPGHHEAVEAPKALEVAWLPPNSAWPQAPGHHGSIVKDTTHHYPRVDIEASPSVMDLVETVAASSTCPSNHVSSLFTDTPRVAEVGSWPSRYDMPPVQALGPLGVPTLRLTGTAIIYGSSPSSPPPPPRGAKKRRFASTTCSPASAQGDSSIVRIGTPASLFMARKNCLSQSSSLLLRPRLHGQVKLAGDAKPAVPFIHALNRERRGPSGRGGGEPRRRSPTKPCSSSRCPPDLSKNLRGRVPLCPRLHLRPQGPGAGTIVHALRTRMEQAIVHQKPLGRLQSKNATSAGRCREPNQGAGASSRRSCAFCRRSHCLPGSTSCVITCG